MNSLRMCSPSATGRWPVSLWLVLLTALLAMGGALRADFYMDDFGFILNRNGDAPVAYRMDLWSVSLGSAAPDSRNMTVFQILPTLMTSITNAWFPMNSAAAHLWNLMIHLTLASLVFRLGERLLNRLNILPSASGCRQAALTGALIFACHPLGTEPVHYAKCHMVQLVALFGFWATCEAVEFFSTGHRKHGWRLLLASGLCVISYFPGTVMLGINLLAVAGFLAAGRNREELLRKAGGLAVLRRPRVALASLGILAVGGALLWFFAHRFFLTVTTWDEYFGRHVVTQGRVFWEYLRRLVIPVGLSSDHYQPWSTFRDTGAVAKLAAFVLLLAGCGVLALKPGPAPRRGIFLLASLILIPFAMRFLYVNAEIMVEYRAYNALPWAGLLAGCGFAALAGKMAASRLRWLPAAGVVTVFTLLSAERGVLWENSILLAEDSLTQYPLNNRARAQIEYFDFHSGRYAAVLDRHEEVVAAFKEVVASNARNGGRVVIDEFRANHALLDSYRLAIYSRAELEGAMAGLAFADRTILSMKQIRPDWFVKNPGQTELGIAPVLEARAAIEEFQRRNPGQ